MECIDLQQQIEQVDDFGDERDQEPIAVALAGKRVSSADTRTRERVNETLAMLDHVHDPFITA